MNDTDKTPKDSYWLISNTAQILIALQIVGALFGLAALFYGEGIIILATFVGGILITMIPWALANMGADNREWRARQLRQLEEQTQLLRGEPSAPGNSRPSPRF